MSQPYPLLNKDFKEFVQFLNANAVEYLVVGGYALMVAFRGVEFAGAYKSRLDVDLDGVSISVISRVDFIRNNLATGPAKDFVDLQELGVDVQQLGKLE